MFDFNWRIAYDEWNGDEGTTDERAEAFKAGCWRLSRRSSPCSRTSDSNRRTAPDG
jgi:hypothetical protein